MSLWLLMYGYMCIGCICSFFLYCLMVWCDFFYGFKEILWINEVCGVWIWGYGFGWWFLFKEKYVDVVCKKFIYEWETVRIVFITGFLRKMIMVRRFII